MPLDIALLLPTFYQFWLLNRHVTFSPIEIAEAFKAPSLRVNDPAVKDDKVGKLLKCIGDMRVRYRAFDVDENGRPVGQVDELISYSMAGELVMI